MNVDKTEILAMHMEDIIEYEVVYEGVDLKIEIVGELKICEIWCCNYVREEYRKKHNLEN